MKKVLLLWLVCVAVGFSQTPIPVDAPYMQRFSLASNAVATATTNTVQSGTNLFLKRGVERATFWSSVQGAAGATASNSFIVYIQPISVTRSGTNNAGVWVTNICSQSEAPITITTTPFGTNLIISAETYDVAGMEGFTASQVNVSGATVTNQVWVTYRQRPQ